VLPAASPSRSLHFPVLLVVQYHLFIEENYVLCAVHIAPSAGQLRAGKSHKFCERIIIKVKVGQFCHLSTK